MKVNGRFIVGVGLLVGLWTHGYGQRPEGTTDFFGIGTGARGRGAAFYGIRKDTFGIQAGLYNDIDLDRNSLSTNNPPNDTQFLGGYKTDPGFGLDLLFFPETNQQSVYFGIGLYYQGVTQVGRSAGSGQLYDLGERNIWRTGFSVGLQSSVSTKSTFGMGYHNLLGWNISLTSRF